MPLHTRWASRVFSAETSVFCTPMPGFTRLAGTLEFSGVNHEMRPRRLEQLTTAAAAYLGWCTGRGDPLGMVRAQTVHSGRDSVRGSGPGAVRALCGYGTRDVRAYTRPGDR